MDCFQILCLDGGGLRGLFTASFLAHLEERKNTKTVDHFDLIVGTSTGGIIALALGLGYSAQQILEFYQAKADSIFPTSFFGATRHWIKTKYSADGLETALRDYFGDRKLGESTSRLVIPAYYPGRAEIHLFKTPHHKRFENDYLEPAALVAQATAAAPSYLPPLEKESGIQLVDGGIWANNPVLVGIAEAIGYLNQDLSNLRVLRIGTTTTPASVEDYPADGGGKLTVAAPLINMMMRAQETSASCIASRMLPEKALYEVNPIVAPADFALDAASQHLVAFGESEYRKHSCNLSAQGYFEHKASIYEPEHHLPASN